MSITDSFQVWFDPKKGGLRVAVPYNGARHNDRRETFSICGGKVQVTQFGDGEFESLEIFSEGAGLNVDVWPRVTRTAR